jgi:hypothetical protein
VLGHKVHQEKSSFGLLEADCRIPGRLNMGKIIPVAHREIPPT